MESLAAHLKQEFTMPHVEPFVLVAMGVQRGSALDRAGGVIDAELAACILPGQFAFESPSADLHRGAEPVGPGIDQDGLLRPDAYTAADQHSSLLEARI